jgi:hypothetical protein
MTTVVTWRSAPADIATGPLAVRDPARPRYPFAAPPSSPQPRPRT